MNASINSTKTMMVISRGMLIKLFFLKLKSVTFLFHFRHEYVKETYGMVSEDGKTNIILEIEHTKQEQKLAKEDKEIWDVADENKDGNLTTEEYIVFFSPEEHPQTLSTILKHTLADKDKNEDGKIDFKEFLGESASHHDKEWLITEKQKFDKDHDADKDGFLNGNEILKWIVPSNE
jgi:reticulocalbin-2